MVRKSFSPSVIGARNLILDSAADQQQVKSVEAAAGTDGKGVPAAGMMAFDDANYRPVEGKVPADGLDPTGRYAAWVQALLSGYNGSTFDRLRSDPSKHLCVNIGGLSNLANDQVSVGNTATVIKAANTSRKSILILNIGSNPIYIGTASVTTANGFKLGVGAAVATGSQAAIYGIVASGTETCCYLEE